MSKPKIEQQKPKTCDYCGSERLEWVKCKLMCRDCRQLVMSCGDLAAEELSAPE